MDMVFPAIQQKISVSHRENIVLQQDDAKPQMAVNEPEIVVAGSEQLWNVILQSQPAYLLDLNILDLGLFSALQTLQYQEPWSNIQDVDTAVEMSFDNYSSDRLSKNFITLQYVMHETIKSNGSNGFKPPHNQKYQIEPKSLSSFNIECEDNYIEGARQYSAA